MTANSKWFKTTSTLLLIQRVENRLYLVSSVFKFNQNALKENVCKHKIIKNVVAMVHTSETKIWNLFYLYFLNVLIKRIR